jgi:hypothetical protein
VTDDYEHHLSIPYFCYTGRTIIVDWAVPKAVFTTNESSTKEETEIKEEAQDDAVEAMSSSAMDVEGCDVQPIEIKNEPLSDGSEGEAHDSDRKSDSSESSDSDAGEDSEAVEERDE